MNQSGDEQAECPLCMEPFEVDDLNFFPCTCGYQICRFCWHRIRTDENGLCPACRKAYPENPADFKPLSQEQMAKLKAEKRQKEQQRKQKATESRKHLANVRVVQKNLVFVVGLPIRLAEPNVLKKHEYFGKFGKIQKVVINQSTSYAGALGPSASAYVTYNRYEDALRAIQAINNIWVDNRQIKTSLGTTKYCSHFIKAQTCPKPDCMYLHDLGDPEASFTKEEMQRGKHQEYEKNLFEQFNNSISQERKTTPSPPALGNPLQNSDSTSAFPGVTKEAWLSLQNGTTQINPGGGTASVPDNSTPENIVPNVTIPTASSSINTLQTVSTTSTKQQQQPPQQQQPQQQSSSKMKQVKEKSNCSNTEKSTSNKKKGKEKQQQQLNGTNTSNQISNNNNNNIVSNNNHNNISNSNNSGSNVSSSSNNNNNNSSNHNLNSAEKNENSSAKINKEKEKQKLNGERNQLENSSNNSRVLLPSNNNRSFYGKNNTFFASNNFSKKSPPGSKDSLPNGFIKVPENVAINYESGFGELNSGSGLSDKEGQELDGKLIGNSESERITEKETEKCLVNGFQTETVNGPFDKDGFLGQRHNNYGYQNGGLSFSNNICQQNIFNNYISLNKFGGQLKNDSNLLLENNEVYLNQSNHLLGQQNFLLKQQLAHQQRNQPSLQQIFIQQQQQQQQPSIYQQPQNQYLQDFRLVQQAQQQQQQQQSSQQSLNGLHSPQNQHFNYMHQSNLRDQLLFQQKQTQLFLNNYPPPSAGSGFVHLAGGGNGGAAGADDLILVDGVIPQHKFNENGCLSHSNVYSTDHKSKENHNNNSHHHQQHHHHHRGKSEENVEREKGPAEISSRLGDDELGFDPFHETQKALADLMEKELLIQQSKHGIQHKGEQYYGSPQCYPQAQQGFDGGCQRGGGGGGGGGSGYSQLQVNMLNQQNNMIGGKLLSQIHSQQILNSASQKSSVSGGGGGSSSSSSRLDGVRCTLPPPGFGSPSHQNGPISHLSGFGQGISRSGSSRKLLPFMGLSSSESSFQPHYVPNGLAKSDEWPESLRSLAQEGRTSSPASSANPSYSSAPKGWSNVANCSDWTALDPAIVSSSRSQHLSIHNQSLLNNQGLSQLHQNHLQNQMCQLNIGSVLGHNNWSTQRQSEDNWSAHIQTTVPPPGFALPHTGGELKKPVISGIEGLE